MSKLSDSSIYDQRGVSADKTDVHLAVKGLDKGLYSKAFCKILPDIVGGSDQYCNIMHADTAGTKTALAYLYWSETGDLEVWKKIAQDAIVMNIDDMACVGCTDRIVLSSTIGRNKHLIPADVLKAIIHGNQHFIDSMHSLGIQIQSAGGETADVGDIVRTVDVGITAFARMPRKDLIINNIQAGNHIVGIASYGQCSYEGSYNSGIGSNGLTSARHDVLSKYYATHYPETVDPNTPTKLQYVGNYRLVDQFEGHRIADLLLSPTRSYLPVIKSILAKYRGAIHGMIHNTGGGHTKVLHFVQNKKIIKDKMPGIPPVFRLIQSQAATPWKEMYKVFNMGIRLEIYTDPQTAKDIVQIVRSFDIDCDVIGRVEESDGNEVFVHTEAGEFIYR